MKIQPSQINNEQVALSWLIRLRWTGVGAQALLTLALHFWLIPTISAKPLYSIVGLGLISNIVAFRFTATAKESATTWLKALLALDIAALTALLYFSGGSANPFSTLYLTQVTIAAVLLTTGWAALVGILASLCYGALFYYFVPVGMDHHMHDASSGGYDLHLKGMWFAFVVVAASTVFFVTRVRNDLRKKERQLERLRYLEAQHEKLAALTTLSAGAAHELSTPLATIGLVVSDVGRQISSQLGVDGLRDDLEIAQSQLGRCKTILQNMSGQFSEYADDDFEETSIEELEHHLRTTFSQDDVAVMSGAENNEETIVLDKSGLCRSVELLLNNALAAPERRSPVRIRIDGDRATVTVSVRNDGTPIPEDLLSRLGEPFFTTKEPGKGMGLGLFLVRLYCQRSDGSFEITSSREHGTQAVIKVPVKRKKYERAA